MSMGPFSSDMASASSSRVTSNCWKMLTVACAAFACGGRGCYLYSYLREADCTMHHCNGLAVARMLVALPDMSAVVQRRD